VEIEVRSAQRVYARIGFLEPGVTGWSSQDPIWHSVGGYATTVAGGPVETAG
jgi:hypothetical protein